MILKLPLDVSTLSILRTHNYLYVDKTEHAYNLITGGRRFFLARPRRFGKTLFVSTLKEILIANKKLLEGLWISNSDYQWHQHGIIALDISALGIKDPATLESGIRYALLSIAQEYGIVIDSSIKSPEIVLSILAKTLKSRFGHVALLIDEYDSAILRILHDVDAARTLRDEFQRFFAAIKGLDHELDFVFIAGVSSFTKSGIFSGMNNLQIITLDERYGDICGYTDQEIDQYCAGYINAWAERDGIEYDELREKIKYWYNGYCFGKTSVSVYNPFSLMHALSTKEFENFWFQSGTPTFLVDVLSKEQTIFDPSVVELTKEGLGVFDVGETPASSLMFQAGYLTIRHYDPMSGLYTLGYPNHEVERSLPKYLFEAFARIPASKAEDLFSQLRKKLTQSNIDEVIDLLKQLFAKVPYQLHGKEEKYYHALLIMIFNAARIATFSEVSTSDGRIDLVLELPEVIYIMEVKFNQSARVALEQIKNREYFLPYLGHEKTTVLLGLSFKRTLHKFVIDYTVETLNRS